MIKIPGVQVEILPGKPPLLLNFEQICDLCSYLHERNTSLDVWMWDSLDWNVARGVWFTPMSTFRNIIALKIENYD